MLGLFLVLLIGYIAYRSGRSLKVLLPLVFFLLLFRSVFHLIGGAVLGVVRALFQLVGSILGGGVLGGIGSLIRAVVIGLLRFIGVLVSLVTSFFFMIVPFFIVIVVVFVFFRNKHR